MDFSREGVSQWRMTRNHGERGIYSTKELKLIINMRVEEYGCKKWVGGIESKSTLILYKNKECPGKEGFYDGSWLSTLLFKARAGALELNGRTYRYNEGHIRGCQLCDLEWGNQETVKHFMAECPAYEMEMDWARERYIQVLGVERFNEEVQGEDAGLGCFLGFDKGVNPGIVDITKAYLGMIWNRRTQLLAQLNMSNPQGSENFFNSIRN